jgi:aryl-alcohol dehydrogenase-like predicted oxidoreductase
MQTRRIGSLDVSVVGLGCNNFGRRIDAASSARVVHAALDAGINFFDTANTYGLGRSEEYLGLALRGRRDDAIIATKGGSPMEGESGGGAPQYLRGALERSLRRLNVDCIDLYQLHEPDPTIPIEETLGAFQDLVVAGKVREIGCSNYSAPMLREADAATRGGPRYVSVQNQYSLLHREPEKEVLTECDRLGMAFLPFYPLQLGYLTGKLRAGETATQDMRLSEERYHHFHTESTVITVERLIAFAEARGHTILELAFSWLLTRPAVASVIAGARHPHQVVQNAAAASWQLTPDELSEIDRITGTSGQQPEPRTCP